MRAKLVSIETERIKGIFSGIEERKLSLIYPNICELARINVDLNELDRVIEIKGMTEEYPAGEGVTATKQTAECKTRDELRRQQLKYSDQLLKEVPQGVNKKSKLDELLKEQGQL